MAYIRFIDEDDAEGKLFEIYDKIQGSRGRLSNILRIESLNPKALQAHLNLYMTLMFGKGELTRRERELIAVVVSAANDCDYGVVHHGEALGQHVKDEKLVKQVAEDLESAALDDREAALAGFAVGLTKDPGSGRKEAVASLRDAGFSDEAILMATEVAAYFNFVNRIATGLGVELEEKGERDYSY